MGRPRSYRIELTARERRSIRHLMKKTSSTNSKTRFSVILAADISRYTYNPTYTQIANQVGASVPTVIDTLEKYCTEGLAAAVTPDRNPNSDTARLKATGDVEAQVIAQACKCAPDGRARWTVSLLTDACAAFLEEPLSRATIGRILKRNDLKPHLNTYWSIPPQEDAEFVANMEDVLDVYQMPFDPHRPVWCLDEKPYQLLGENREPVPMKPGNVEKIDYEYVRNGIASIFCIMQPHSGRIIHFVEETRTSLDWAEKVKYLVDVIEPEADKIILVLDNLNTHKIASLYKAFPPDEARRIAKKLEIHYTPKHGSWLNIAEIGLNIMTRQCLDRRIPGIEVLRSELTAWNDDYSRDPSPVDWQFTTNDSRTKLKRLYPNIKKFEENRAERRDAKGL